MEDTALEKLHGRKITTIRSTMIDSVNMRFDTNFPETKKSRLTIHQVFDVTI